MIVTERVIPCIFSGMMTQFMLCGHRCRFTWVGNGVCVRRKCGTVTSTMADFDLCEKS